MLAPHFENLDNIIAQLLAKAEREVLVAVAWLTHPRLTDALADSAKRGCRVVLIINDDTINAGYCPVAYLRGSGVQVLLHPLADEFAPIMHHKFCVIDGHTTITGSFNWTRKATTNDENIIVLQNDARFANEFVDTFMALAQRMGVYLGQGVVLSPLYGFYKQRIELLEVEIAALQAAIEQAQQLVRHFEQAYWAKLGALLREIAHYEALIAERNAERNQKAYAQKAAKEARQRFEQYSAQAEAAAPPRPALSEEAAQSLRDLFRKIVKLIHPDRYANDPEKCAQANQLMAEANAAYQAQDIARLKKLLDRLETDWGQDADQLPDHLEGLQQLVETLIRRRDELTSQLGQLTQQATCLAAQSPDWEALFAAEAVKLEAQLSQLKREMAAG
jgi:hypothetical protein